MAITISLSGAATSAVYAADTDSVNGTPLIFTEIVPDTDNVSGADAYRYLEIFNSNNSDIKLTIMKFTIPTPTAILSGLPTRAT